MALERRLSAILAADVVGFSRMIRADEEGTLLALRDLRETLIDPKITQHKGRIVKLMGDGMLVEFASVVDTVSCGVEVQKSMATHHAERAGEPRFVFWVGINLGDVIVEDDRIYGDGINIAARLESLADPGGICVSKTAFDQIETKLPLGYEYLGEQSVKNIPKPVGTYRVLMEPRVTVSRKLDKEKALTLKRRRVVISGIVMLFVVCIALAVWNFYFRPSTSSERLSPELTPESELSKIPSIAVLPFDNLSDEPNQEYFTDGMTDDLITGLSKLKGLLVIARNSTFTYKGKSVKVQQVADELGVRYVVEGSVRRAGEQVRINVQLIDAVTGHHIWAERYDGKMADIFALQDQINQKIISTLEVKLTAVEKSRIARKATTSVNAYDAFLRGWEHYKQMTPEDFSKASSYFKEAIDLDPIYARAYAALALLYFRALDIGWQRWVANTTFPRARLDARKYLKMAMKEPSSLAYQATALTLIRKRLYPEAIDEAEKALALDPNDAYSYFIMAKILNYAGKSEKAIDFAKRALRLDPHYPVDYLIVLGESNFALGNLEEAAIYLGKAQERNPHNRPNKTLLEFLIATYSHIGRDEEVQVLFESLKTVLHPPISLRRIMNSHPYNTPEVTDRLAQGLIKAGMPEEAYYTASYEDRLGGKKIRALVFGRTMQSLDYRLGFEVWSEIAKDGKATRPKDIGRYWIDSDMLCSQWQKLGFGAEWCGPVFRNPLGSPESSDEYLLINDWGIIPFTLVD